MKKTKKLISNALLNIIARKHLYEVSIKDIVMTAGISKGTFYNNFKNIDEVISFTFNDIDDLVSSEFVLKETNQDIDSIIDYASTNLIPLIYDNREQIKILYSGSLNGEWKRFLERKYTALLKDYLESEMVANLVVKYTIDIIDIWITSPIPTSFYDFEHNFRYLFNVKISELSV